MKVWTAQYYPHDIEGAINELVGIYTTREKASAGVARHFDNWVNSKRFTLSKTSDEVIDMYENGVKIGYYFFDQETLDPDDNSEDNP